MDIYNRARTKIDKTFERETKRVKEPERRASPISEDIELNESCKTLIDQIKSQSIVDTRHGSYQTLLTILRREFSRDNITQTQFNYYKKMADEVISQNQKKVQKKERTKQKKLEVEDDSGPTYDAPAIQKKDEADRLRVRGERNIDEEMLKEKEEEKGKRIGRFKALVEFMQTPIARVLIFIILGIFLLVYLTRSSMTDALGSPLIIVLVIVFILFILGKGGKARHHNYDESQNNY